MVHAEQTKQSKSVAEQGKTPSSLQCQNDKQRTNERTNDSNRVITIASEIAIVIVRARAALILALSSKQVHKQAASRNHQATS